MCIALLLLATSGVIVDLVQTPPTGRSASSLLASLAAEAQQIEGADDGAGLFDLHGHGRWLNDFESRVAADLGVEAATFMPTTLAAHLSALAVHAELPTPSRSSLRPSFVAHAACHQLLHGEGSHAALLGLTALTAGQRSRPLSSGDVDAELRRQQAVGLAPSCVVVELPARELGNAATPWDELCRLRALLDTCGVPLHADGARLLEVAPFYARSPAQLTALCDSLVLPLDDGLGALAGAVLLGSAPFVRRAAAWRRRLGAGARTSLPSALSCSMAYSAARADTAAFEARWRALRRLAALLVAASDGRVRFEPPEPHCCAAHCYVRAASAAALDAARDAALRATGVRVYRELRGGEAVGGECCFEWVLGPEQLGTSDETVLRAWAALLEALPESSEG